MPDYWGEITPRAWQAAALPDVIAAVRRGERTIVSAVMGAGKSILIAALVRAALERSGERVIVIATPTRKLVRQLGKTMASVCGAENVGLFYSEKKQADRRVVVTCNPSLATLTAELTARARRCALLIQDEAHSSEAQTVRDVIPLLAPASMVGFTATPFRSTDAESLSLWDSICHRYTLGDALTDRVLVPWLTVCYAGGGQFSSLSEPLHEIPSVESDEVDDICYRAIVGYTEGPGIVSALTIGDAEHYAEYLTDRGLDALAVHSRMTTDEQERAIRMLEAGALRAVVHVSMLSEGVDFPWLRWGCLRRPVGARVRFMQELGRFLRSHPGKTHATIIDPHDLLGSLGLQHAEALGEALQEAADEDAQRGDGNGPPQPVDLPEAVAIDRATLWAREVLLGLQAAGVASTEGPPDGYWRDAPPSPRQIASLQKMSRTYLRHLPDSYRDTIGGLVRGAPRLQRGAVADLLSVFHSVADAAPGHWSQRRGWRYDWPTTVDVPALTPETRERLCS